MQVNAPCPGLTTPASNLRQVNTTPQLTLPLPASTIATILTSFPVPGTGESFAGQLLLNETQELLSYLSERPLKVGQTLELQSTGTQGFRVINQEPPGSTLMQLATQTLKDLLPQTAPDTLQQLGQRLEELLQQPAGALPNSLLTQAGIILQQIPVLGQGHWAERLKNWVESSRIAPESLLANQQLPAATDPEQLMQQLLDTIEVILHAGDAPHSAGDTQQILGDQILVNDPNTPDQEAEPLVYVIKRRPAPPALLSHSPTDAAVSAQQNSAPENAELPLATAALPPPDLNRLFNELKTQVQSFLANQQLHRALAALPTNALPITSPLQHLSTETQQILFAGQIPLMVQQKIQTLDLQIGKGLDEKDENGEQDTPGTRRTASGASQPRWIISLGFQLHQLGAVLIRGELQQQSLRADFWSDRSPTLRLMQENMPWLREQLLHLGIETAAVQTHLGLPQREINDAPLRLIDVSI